ncbi:cytochrome P450 [Streptomyces sp. MZ04]|uniref:cytochrome P450 n=1 Tax=Streptomyces sp. MZ04 TaxID=2559236 RepID=UPI001432F9E2|nr:cytochrome P450 [Streptomyces sp. MZ04]
MRPGKAATSLQHSTPVAPGGLPLLGHVVPLLRDPFRFLTSLPAHGDVVRIRIGPFPAYVLCEPELTRQVLVDDRTFDKGGMLFDRVRDLLLGHGMATCPHSAHRPLRRLAQPAFHSNRLPGYAQAMAEEIATTTGRWHDGKAIDVLAEMHELAARVVVRTMFAGLPLRVPVTAVLSDLMAVFPGIYQRMMVPPALEKLPLPGSRGWNRARQRLRGAFAQLIDDHRTRGTVEDDLLSMLLSGANSPDTAHDVPHLSGDEVVDQMLTFFIGAVETTAATLAWALHLLAGHPDIEEELHAEVDAVLCGRAAAFEDLDRLSLTGRVITETLRLYPPGWFFTRTATAESTVGGHVIPVGATVVYSPYVIHHLPHLYPEPDSFLPGRWDGQSDAAHPNPALIPFGGGARKWASDDPSTPGNVLFGPLPR